MTEDTLKIIFARNLNHYLDINNKRQDDLVRDLSISPSTISSWCTGQKFPRMNKIETLANYFGIEKSSLIEDKAAKPDSDVEEYLEYLHKRPEMKMLFRASKNVSKEQLEQVVKMIESFAPQDYDE